MILIYSTFPTCKPLFGVNIEKEAILASQNFSWIEKVILEAPPYGLSGVQNLNYTISNIMRILTL